MPKVSVIIPVFNGASYINDTIDSVLCQVYRDFEIVVVDDGSTDNTREMLRKYNGHVKYIYQENSGVSVARNRAIHESRGEYIAFLDHDDIWYPDKLSIQVAELDADPEVAMVFTDGELFNETGAIAGRFLNFNPSTLRKNNLKFRISQLSFNDGSKLKGNFYKDLISGNSVFNSSVIVRKETLGIVGYVDKNLSVNADYDLWIRIAGKFKILYINKITARFRVREDSQSGPMNIRPYRYRKFDGELFENHLKVCNREFRSLVKKRIHECYAVAAWGYFNINNMKDARKLCVRSLRYDMFKWKIYLYLILSYLPISALLCLKKLKANINSLWQN